MWLRSPRTAGVEAGRRACSFDFGWGFRRVRICDQTGVMGKVTLQTIADRLGVSRMTVSNAFSRPDQLSAELRDKIMAAADELGYVGPDPAARALATGSAGTVGVLLTDTLSYAFEDEFAARFLAGIAEELAPIGLGVDVADVVGPGRERAGA